MPEYVPIAISYTQGGLVKDRAAFNLTDDSFQTLENAYNFRGRIRRRQGYALLGRLRRDFIAQTLDINGIAMSYTPPGIGSFPIPIFTVYGINVLEPNANLVPGTVLEPLIFILDPGGASETIFTDTLGTGALTITGGAPIVSAATINYATGIITATFTIAPGPLTVSFTLSYYPSLPAMGTRTFETMVINQELLIAFDTRYAYIYSVVLSRFTELVPGTTWNGSNSQFFYTFNILIPNSSTILFFATNFNFDGVIRDPIRYYDGSTWITFEPFLDTPNTIRLLQARIIVQYKGRVVALHTIEGANLGVGVQYPQRARWSQFGSPITADAWISDVSGAGGFIDCPTSEQIVSAEFIRDTLVVGFERSTWKLRYTGNQLSPFVWDRINKELGTESTFSPVAFDKGILSIGDKSINVCDGNGVEPIDQNIPDDVFQIHNGNSGPFRIQGIRDFYLRQVYWTFPSAQNNPTFPNRLFVFDYEKLSWSIFTDHFTVLGNWQRTTDIRWIDLRIPWNTANMSWEAAPLQSEFPNIVAGNQQGYVFVLNQMVMNDPSLSISDVSSATTIVVLTVVNHNMQTNEVVRVSGIIGNGSALNDRTFFINVLTDDTFELQEYDSNTGLIEPVLGSVGTYVGGGQIERVFNMQIRSKKFNLLSQGSRGEFGYIDFLTESTEDGEVACEIRTDYNESTAINPEIFGNNDNFYNSTFSTQQNATYNISGTQVWQRFYCPTSAQFFDFTLTFTQRQMATPAIINSDVRIEAFLVWLSKGGRLVK